MDAELAMAREGSAGRRKFLRFVKFRTLALGFAIAGVVMVAASRNAVQAETQPTLAPSSAPVTLDISITLSRQTVARQDPIDVFIIVTNKSQTDIRDLAVSVLNSDFSLNTPPSLPSQLAGYNSAQGTASIEAKPTAQFRQQQVLFTFTYTWSNQGKPVMGAQGSAATIQVTRPFDEEAKGLLGGGAALLYLLLPVIPLVLAYELLAGFLTGNLKFPTFGMEYVVPAFLFAVLINLLLLLFVRNTSVDYTAPIPMLVILLVSLAAGAVLAIARNFRDFRLFVRWRYKQDDKPLAHVTKVLLRPGAAAAYVKATGTDAEGTLWSGILLHQPAAGPALGSSFQVSRPEHVPDGQTAVSNDELGAIFTLERSLRPGRQPRRILIDMLKSKRLILDYTGTPITQDGASLVDVSVRTDLKGFSESQRTPADFIVRT